MNMARTVIALVFALIAGLIGYQIGITQSIAAQVPAGAAPVYAYPYWHWGFGFFGLLFPLLFLFLIFGLARAAFWGGRGHWGQCRRSRSGLRLPWRARRRRRPCAQNRRALLPGPRAWNP